MQTRFETVDFVPGARVIACRGSVQLVAALAAANTRAAGQAGAGEMERVFVIHDLCAPAGQDADFAQCLVQLARWVDERAKIVYLHPDEIESLRRLGSENSLPASERLRERLGVDRARELYLGHNPTLLNDLLIGAYPGATRISYGDGIGVNFSPRYFAAVQRQSAWHSARRALKEFVRHKILARPVREQIAPRRTFDEHYLLLPNCFDEVVSPCVRLEPGQFVDLFLRFASYLDHEPLIKANQLGAMLERQKHVVVLLTSNFSEACKMSLDAELAAYRELAAAHPAGESVALVVKPHPRDSLEKIARLEALLACAYEEVLVLDDPCSFYLPFETVFARHVLPRDDWKRKTSLLCVSSACLSFEYLYGAACTIGFGEASVRKYFQRDWIPHRLRHEHDLCQIVYGLRQAHRAAA